MRALAAIAPQAGVFCDFDGTLSEIVERHEDAVAYPEAAGALEILAGRFALVAVISGRHLDDLTARIRAPGVRFVGSYGLEDERDGARWTHPDAKAQRAAIERATAYLEAHVPEGVRVEHKSLAVAIHLRPARDPVSAQRAAEPMIRELARAERLDVLEGRLVLELRPRIEIDKGQAARRLISDHQLRGALVLGDDAGDIVMFDALEGLDIAVRVGVESPEMPAALRARADLLVSGPEEVVALLRSLASA